MTGSQSSTADARRVGSVCCSFCLKDKDSVAKLVAGLGVYICNECVGLCNLILAQEPEPEQEPASASAPRVGGWEEQPDEALLANLGRLQAVVSQVDAAFHNHVGMLRARGVSWTRIGEALGVSKQAAWERFSGED
ncbi:MAG TPA: ClpX C4-type zinc finger protein [Trebonia sp.]|nr:ClpX C4-type zinc finger protein [Trebonia sp.]